MELNKIAGPLTGLIFGVVLVWAGPGPAFGVLALILLGWFIGKIVNGEIDLIGFLYNRSRGRKQEDKIDSLMKR